MKFSHWHRISKALITYAPPTIAVPTITPVAGVHLELIREKAKRFPEVPQALEIRSAKIWHCSYTSLAALATLANLEALVIATYPDESFGPIERLTDLRYLRILHFPKVSDLTPIRELQHLETLSLSSLPSWDASGKVITVKSLAPIAALPRLRHLELFGVRPTDKSLSPLHGASSLTSARISKYPKAELAAFYAQTGATDDFAPEPAFYE